MAKFEKLCLHGGKWYAVVCDGEEHKIGKISYFISKTLDEKQWCVTMGPNGRMVAKSNSKEELVTLLEELHETMGPTGLKKAKHITEAEYKKIIAGGKKDGE